ncbi:MAG: plastocyanin/azurin family copper-binding protein [Thaumarchaeota archaeon]|nr:plastocyanin/azurin family copper-binding protein [Nitrososphaerota archaeon]
MNKTEKILLGLAAAAALFLSLGVAYSATAAHQYRQTGTVGGMIGGGSNGGMMGRSYPGGTTGVPSMGGMMGAASYANGMMAGFGSMTTWMTQHMVGFWNQTWGGSHGGASAYVVMVGHSFYPANISIATGTTVTWVNMDFVQHTVTSGAEGAQTGLFDSHELNQMQSFSYTFSTPGTFAYYCGIHPGMIGTVSVTG